MRVNDKYYNGWRAAEGIRRKQLSTKHCRLVPVYPHMLGISPDKVDPRVKYRTHVNKGKHYGKVKALLQAAE